MHTHSLSTKTGERLLTDLFALSVDEFSEEHADKDIRVNDESVAVQFQPKNLDERQSARCTLTAFLDEHVVRFQLRYEFDGSVTFSEVASVLETLEESTQIIQETAKESKYVKGNSGNIDDVFSTISFEDYTLVFESVFKRKDEQKED